MQVFADAALARTRILPVLQLEDAALAAPLARALVQGGVPVAEITLRTPAALAAIARLRRTEPGLLVGAGTVVTATQVREAAGAGAQFVVSPGLDEGIVQAAQTAGLAVYPGAVTATELQAAQRLGLGVVKFFPAAQSGGPAAIRALHGPFPGLQLLPTGGITLENLAAYLRCPAVLACGGSFLAPADVLARGDWAAVSSGSATRPGPSRRRYPMDKERNTKITQQDPPRVVTFGEILLRLSAPGYERLLQSPRLEATFGGGEANVAVSLANFGLQKPLSQSCPTMPWARQR